MRPPRWLEALLLSGFDEDERQDVLQDLDELARDRGGPGEAFYYWRELTKYPMRRAWDALRHRRDHEVGTGRRGTMESFVRDTRYAVRSLVRKPGFSVMAILILGISMGAATAVASVVRHVLLDPLPVHEPERLVSLWLEGDAGQRSRMTPAYFTDISALERVFSGVAAFAGETASLTRDGDPVFLRGSRVTPGYFETLGVEARIGRAFRPEEGEAGGAPVVILGHHVWQQLFGADPSIVQRTVELDGETFDVVGVAPPGVYPTHATVAAELPFSVSNQDFFVPLRYSDAGWANRRSHVLGAIGRLAPGMGPELAHQRLAALGERLRQTEPLNANESALMTSFTEEVVGNVRFALVTLLGSVALVLLIAIANVGALFALRADDRAPELAVRTALGAPRARLVRQLMLESGTIAAVASVAAVGVATLSVEAMQRLVPYQIPRLADVTVDGVTLAGVVAIGAFIALVLGLVPALRLRGGRWGAAVGRARQTRDVGQRRLQSAVVAMQAGLCVTVLVGATLLGRSYAALRSVDPGFSERGTWAMSIPAEPDAMSEIVRGVRELPGVAAAAVAYDHPLERNWGDGFLIEGANRTDSDPPTVASLRPFGEQYFETVGIEVREGRLPDASDADRTIGAAVINETLRDTFFPDGAAVGAHVVLPTAQRMLGSEGRFEIVGVVRDVRFLGPDTPASPALYVPLTHFPVNATTLLVRSKVKGAVVVADVRDVVSAIDGRLGLQQARRLSDILDDLLARPRFNMMLLVSFGALSLVLCGLGAYGLVGRVVAMRSREIGIQMALGAEAWDLGARVMLNAIRPVAVGGMFGLLLAAALARTIQALLFGISPADPISFVSAAAFLLTVGMAAALLPTRRAVSIDPATVLRSN